MTRADHLPPLKRVGHKGADLIAPGNTIESFQAALDHGVHMIEFDILPAADGRLVLAHDPVDAASRECVTLEEGLEHFAGEAYADVELDVDLKAPGYERDVVEALVEHGLVERSLVTSTYLETMDTLGGLGVPGLRRGWSVPRARRDYTKSKLAPAVYVALLAGRRALPIHSARLLRAGRIEAVMTHFLLLSERLVRAVHREGGQVYVWTVDDPDQIARFESMGVDGVITNDPRLFD
jgi:glycerophosphoryl diester phosphodiesterase